MRRVDEVAAQPREDADHHAHDGRRAGREAVQAVAEVGAVGAGGDHDHDHQHVDGPLRIPAPGPLEGREPAVVELVALDEGDGGLGGLHRILLLVAAGGDLRLRVHVQVGTSGDDFDGRVGHLLADDDVRAHPDGQAHEEAERHLPQELHLLGEAVVLLGVADAVLRALLVLDLEIVVGETQGAAPEGAHQQQDDVDARQVAEQQDAGQQAQDDDDAAHRGNALLELGAVKAQVAGDVADLVALQDADDALAHEHREQHRRHRGHHRPEGQVVHQSHAGDVHPGLLEISEQMVNHYRISLKVSATISFSSKCSFSCPMIW